MTRKFLDVTKQQQNKRRASQMLGQRIVLIIIKNPQMTASMAVIFDGNNLTASEAVIFGSVQVVFFYCPFLDCLYHVVTTLTVGVTSFTNHSADS